MSHNLSKHDLEKLLQPIKMVLLDCDGILTDGSLYYDRQAKSFSRVFNSRDGFLIRHLPKNTKIKIAVISGGKDESMAFRFEMLGLAYAYLNHEDKRAAFNEILEKEAIGPENILYMGDDLSDIPLLKRAGFSATAPEASLEVKEHCHYVTSTGAGKGCVREVLDMLVRAQKIKINIPDFE